MKHNKTRASSCCTPKTYSHALFVLGLITALAIVVYGRCVAFESTLYDDPQIIFENPHVMAGLTFDSVYWAFTQPNLGLYMPLPTISFMLDANLFGDWAGGYHGMTLLWHVLCVCTFYLVMMRLFNHFPIVFTATLLMTVHPIQAMTVNWVSARNEIMPAFFMLLSIEMYRRFCASRARSLSAQTPVQDDRQHGVFDFSIRTLRYMLFSLLFMLLALLSKQGPVMLPAILLLLDYWPLGRIEVSFGAPRKTLLMAMRLIMEKAPYFVLSGIGVFFAFYGKTDFGVLDRNTLTSPIENIGFAMTAYLRYLGHMAYPFNYIMAYSKSVEHFPSWTPYAAGALLLAFTIFALAQYQRRPYLLVGWGWFCLLLLPVSGLVRYATESIALRYLYAPGAGLYLLVAFALYELFQRLGHGRTATPFLQSTTAPKRYWAATGAITILLAACCYWQSGFWRDSETLAWRAMAVTKNRNAMAHNHLGVMRERQGLQNQAFAHFQASTQLEPTSRTYRYNYAIALSKRNRYQEVIELLEPVMPANSEYVPVLTQYGVALAGLDRIKEAMPYFERSLEIEPNYVPALFNMGFSLLILDQQDAARPYFERVLEIQPTHRSAQLALQHFATP